MRGLISAAVLPLLLLAGATDPDDVNPIEFEQAMRTAMASMRDGHGADAAMEQAGRVLEGEMPFDSIRAPGSSDSWAYAAGWLSESDARLLQHEVVTCKEWPQHLDAPSARHLMLRSPLPTWATEIAKRLSPALEPHVFDCCDIYACEPGQHAMLELPETGATAVITLGSDTSLSTAAKGVEPKQGPLVDQPTVSLGARSALVIQQPHAARSKPVSACLVHSRHGRFLSLVFTCSRAASSSTK